ncbi:MAG: biotin transporter BioY [Oscillospiraceae bacterium]|nr:biotin transporter BioY [Oscillospiraceae bacterium]
MAKKFSIKDMVLCALLAAMTGILSQIGIPIGEVPINLALFSVFLAGGLLGSYKGAVSIAVYVMMGAVGIPVFSNFRGGLSVLVGPTGGYILGYLLAALVVGMVSTHWGDAFWKLAIGMASGLALCYLFGTAWFILLTGKGLVAALGACVIPFLPGDAAKIILAALLVPELKKAIQFSRRLP